MIPSTDSSRLSPLPVRLAIWLVLLALALACVWLLDGRAMQTLLRHSHPAHTDGDSPLR